MQRKRVERLAVVTDEGNVTFLLDDFGHHVPGDGEGPGPAREDGAAACEDQASTRLGRIVRHRTGRAEVADVGSNDPMPGLDDGELAGVDVGAQLRKLREAIEHLPLDLGFVFGETQGIELRREGPNRRGISAGRRRLPLPPPLSKLCVCRICLSLPEPAEKMHGLRGMLSVGSLQSAVGSRQSAVGSLSPLRSRAFGCGGALPPRQCPDDRDRHNRQDGDRRPQRETSDSSCHCLPPDCDEAPDTHRDLEMPEKLQTPRQPPPDDRRLTTAD